MRVGNFVEWVSAEGSGNALIDDKRSSTRVFYDAIINVVLL